MKIDPSLKGSMDTLVEQLLNDTSEEGSKSKVQAYKRVIAQAVSLGMMYQKHKIKAGIDIVFDEA